MPPLGGAATALQLSHEGAKGSRSWCINSRHDLLANTILTRHAAFLIALSSAFAFLLQLGDPSGTLKNTYLLGAASIGVRRL